MRTLKMDGMEKMLMGLTDLEAGPVGVHQIAVLSLGAI
jgi:hypothetical protein